MIVSEENKTFIIKVSDSFDRIKQFGDGFENKVALELV